MVRDSGIVRDACSYGPYCRVYLGDEPCHTANEQYVRNADWLLSDSDLENRAERYAKEAGMNFKGNIFVPCDLDVISIL